MNLRSTVVLVSGFMLVSPLLAQDSVTRARQLETSGDSQGALRVLRDAANSSTVLPANLAAYADFLDRHNSPEARRAYVRLAGVLSSNDAKRPVLHRLVTLNLLAG